MNLFNLIRVFVICWINSLYIENICCKWHTNLILCFTKWLSNRNVIFCLREFAWYVSSDFLIEWRIVDKNHICNFIVLHGVSGCDSSDYLFVWRIVYNNNICNFFVLHGVSWCESCLRYPGQKKDFPQELHL